MNGTKPIRINDVAEVKIGSAPKIGDASIMTEPSVVMTVTKQPNANTINLTASVDELLDDIERQLPKGVILHRHIFRQTDFIQASINNLKTTLIEGAIFVCIILFLFLLNWRTTIISLVAIPVALLVTIIIMKLLGFTINTMSLGGMAIAIGALVDDAIIDVENIYKRLRENTLKIEAERLSSLKIIYEASSEIRNSILIATLIIIASFIPLFFLSGMEGRLLKPLGISFIIAIFTSLFVAVTLTPVMSSYLLTNELRLKKQSKGSFLERNAIAFYQKVITFVLNFPKTIIAGAVLLFVIAGFIFF